ncbi:MAG: hypothetical protein HYZ17_00985 [Betaproteobacteria bacterium]|nr:hypothetical protein [Betaproteobacteria bacterium]
MLPKFAPVFCAVAAFALSQGAVAAIGAGSSLDDIAAALARDSDLRQVTNWFKAGATEAPLVGGVSKAQGKDGVASVLCPLVKIGANAATLTKAAVAAGVRPARAIEEAACNGAAREELVAAAIEAGADPTEFTEGTAAGGQATGSRTIIITTPLPGAGGRAVVSRS